MHYMLSVWGRVNRGDDSPAGAINVIGRLMIRSHWSEDKANQIERVVMRLYEEDGLRGDVLYQKARELVILNHRSAISSLSPKNQMMPLSLNA